jgi:hypothetical protein
MGMITVEISSRCRLRLIAKAVRSMRERGRAGAGERLTDTGRGHIFP